MKGFGRVAGALCLVAGLGGPLQPEAAAQETHALVVVGLGGTEEYRERFNALATELHGALISRLGLEASNVIVLTERTELAPGVARDRSTRENVMGALAEIAGRAGPSDRLLVVLIGHGTSQGDEAQFNLPGPDLGPEDFAAGLGTLPGQAVALVHTGSASGGFVAPLSGPNRVVITSTRSARERDLPVFPQYFVEAFTGDGSDLDKDGQISLLEAFQYASREVARHYEEANELATEHAVLDDNGDGEGSVDAAVDAADGPLAASFRLGMASVAEVPTTDDPELARLFEERRAIQQRLDQLRAAKAAIPVERYEQELESILVELALKNREIRAREGGR